MDPFTIWLRCFQSGYFPEKKIENRKTLAESNMVLANSNMVWLRLPKLLASSLSSLPPSRYRGSPRKNLFNP
jgi:hypothetical protein